MDKINHQINYNLQFTLLSPFFVRDTDSIIDCLQKMREAMIPIAVVVDKKNQYLGNFLAKAYLLKARGWGNREQHLTEELKVSSVMDKTILPMTLSQIDLAPQYMWQHSIKYLPISISNEKKEK